MTSPNLPTSTAAKVILSVEGITMRYGGLTAIENLHLAVAEGTIHGLIGPNGAGKTTLFNVLSGLERPQSGRIRFQEQLITGLPAHRLAALGIMRTFQNLQLFPGMSVLENVLLGAHCHLRSDLVEALFHLQRGRKEDVSAIHTAHEVLAFTRIDHLSHATASSLPYGHQRLLEIARALAGKPRLLLLDEPAAGMNPAEKQNLLDLLRRIQERGATILLVEHDMRLVMQVCSQISVLNFGRKLCDGAPEEVQRDAAVISAYLGAGGSGGAAGGLDLEAGNAGTS